MNAPASGPAEPRRVLVLGAYGLIGSGVARHLRAAGHHVSGLGRSDATARRVLPHTRWIIRDMATLLAAADWLPVVEGHDTVVNCAGALQDGPRDQLQAIHADAVAALAEACRQKSVRLVQISAAGVSDQASTSFFRTKAAGDAAIRAAGGDFTILRPGLVLAPTAYGGTTLLRMLAAFPAVQPIALPDTLLRTVSLSDLALAVEKAATGELGTGETIDLVEERPHTLSAIVAGMRKWLGFAPARLQITMPPAVTRLVSSGADALGLLGWRSPLRSTAIAVMQDGVDGEPARWRALTGRAVSSFEQTLASMPARSEDRIAARMALAMPFAVAALFILWAVSGVVGFLRVDAASGVLTAGGWPDGLARASVLFWSAVDIALAMLILIRRYAARACLAMAGVSLVYLAAASLFTPWLWADPLGSLVKIVPIIVLALVTSAMLQER
ncbi:SDR family oxidoreductase [Oricola sp.]|uniref:SDR family oxidoreductase n=1 Tax=Oricola sp. TaxID=1979950 RepID=UPI0025E2F709|nr:SDR family oxidoreductase [Oricola sp.]MCI5075801.1 SDR family oxidoreductase [Oricola sp.]